MFPIQNVWTIRLLVCLSLTSLSAWVFANAAEDEWPDWVKAEESLHQRIAKVNEGHLTFLANQPTSPVHHHHNRIVISEHSLVDGWVALEQCHDNLDQVAALQIIFNPQRSRLLEVISFDNIQSAVAEDHSVQLRGVQAHSRVCLRLETKALRLVANDVFELKNGPFMRRFLDGYYPMRVSLAIEYPESLSLADFSPGMQPGFSVSQTPGRVAAEALFEGMLRTSFRFMTD